MRSKTVWTLGIVSAAAMIWLSVGKLGLAESEKDEWLDHFHPSLHDFVQGFRGLGEGVDGAESVQARVPSPEEMIQSFQLAESLEIEVVAAEPQVQQPLDLHFDERGRLWVVQYIQYPFPAGLKVLEYDRYLRAIFDKVPPPPPNHDRGADKITILEDKDGDGTFESIKDFVTGLNLVTSVAVGRGGVWVLNPPYLLFYPDHNQDDVPDGNPEVHLSGFGLEDTHAVANSIRWGPDGWLYGVQGSTTTATVQGIHFLGQAAWRYHPETREFELFAEGGGNTWSLVFDSKGRAFSGTNRGNTRGVHYAQDAYFEKGFSKHGPLTNPFSFGYFHHMEHEGYKPRFPQAMTVYEGGALPGREGHIIAGMSLTNRVQGSEVIPTGATFRTVDTEPLLTTENEWFRPVAVKQGPDGAVYLADWCDFRLSHLSPRTNWQKICGRIYRLKSKTAGYTEPFDLSRLSNRELTEVFSHPNRWFREQARRIFADRKDPEIVPYLKTLLQENTGQIALEALWALNLSGGFSQDLAAELFRHPDPHVRLWSVRLIGDRHQAGPKVAEGLLQLARSEKNIEVRTQLASSIRRLPLQRSLPVLRQMLVTAKDAENDRIPLLLWWTLADWIAEDREEVLAMLQDPSVWKAPLVKRHLARRIGMRFTAERGDKMFYTFSDDYAAIYSEWKSTFDLQKSYQNLEICHQLLQVSPEETDRQLVAGMNAGLGTTALKVVPPAFQEHLRQRLDQFPGQVETVSLALRLNVPGSVPLALEALRKEDWPAEQKLITAKALADSGVTAAIPDLLQFFAVAESEAVKLDLVQVLSRFKQPEVAQNLIELHPVQSPGVQEKIKDALLERQTWTRMMLASMAENQVDEIALDVRDLERIRELEDPEMERLLARVDPDQFSQKDPGDRVVRVSLGQENYLSSCGYCHLASGDGMTKSLAGSRWVLGPEAALIRIVLHGKEGEETMPPFGGVLDDQEIATVLTYVRSEWGNDAPAVEPSDVARVRRETSERDEAWKETELQKLLSASHE